MILGKTNYQSIHDDAALRRARHGVSYLENSEIFYSSRQCALKKLYGIGSLDVDWFLRDIVQHNASSQFPIVSNDVFSKRNRIQARVVNSEDRVFGGPFVNVRRAFESLRVQAQDRMRRRMNDIGHIGRFRSIVHGAIPPVV